MLRVGGGALAGSKHRPGDGTTELDAVQFQDLEEGLVLDHTGLGLVQRTQEFLDFHLEAVSELHEEDLLLNAIL